MEKRTKSIKKVIPSKTFLFIIIAGIFFITTYLYYQNRHVQFADENMGIVICNTIGEGVTPENVRYKDLEKVEELQTGFLGFYDTLKDIKKCRNLKSLDINSRSLKEDPCFSVTSDKLGKINAGEEVEKLQEELKEILPALRNLNEFSFTNTGNNCRITNINFLMGCKKLETVWIIHCDITDYTVLQTLPKLKDIRMVGSSIEKADDLLNIKKAERFFLRKTPLSKNKKEMKKLYEKFPNAEIFIE